MNTSKDSANTDTPVNSSISDIEYLARNIYETSQYSKHKLKKNRFYPNIKRESRSYPGCHVCRLSVQRLCFAGWKNAIYWANRTKNVNQQLIGFEIAPASAVLALGFGLEPFAHKANPFHAHIYIGELDKPFEQPEKVMESIMESKVRHRLDNMARNFKFIKIDEIDAQNEIFDAPHCAQCLSGDKATINNT